MTSDKRLLLVVFRSELTRLLRDRRALFTAVILPMLLFPVMFLGMDELGKSAEKRLEARTSYVVYELDLLGEDLSARVLAALEAPERNLELAPAPAGLIAELARKSVDELREEALTDERNLVLVGREGPDGPLVELTYNGSRERSKEARDRVRDALNELIDAGRLETLGALVGSDPGAPLETEETDLASAEDAAGHRLGKLLPLLAALMLVSGASFAALDAFAGERENGTLETLLVQPVPASAVARGKFLVVVLTGLAALLGNATSFVACLAFGLGDAGPDISGAALGTTLVRTLGGLVLYLPTALLLGALLCLVSARAKSFREGQHYVLPLVLLVMAPASLGAIDRLEFHPLLALVPIGGTSLAFRDALSGSLSPLLGLLSFAAASGWALLALRKLDATLDAERWLSAPPRSKEYGAGHAAASRAIAWGAVGVLGIYLVGGWLQSRSLVPGLLATLWLLLPLLACLAVRATRAPDTGWLEHLGLVRPAAHHLLGAVLAAVAAVPLSHAAIELQARFLPLPGNLTIPGIEELSLLQLLLVAALSPALMEELFFRGAILGGLRRGMKPGRVILWQALLFGAAHGSVHRFAITGSLGALLAAVTLRAGSLWPAVLLHGTYNGLQAWLGFHELEPSMWLALLALPAAFLFRRPR